MQVPGWWPAESDGTRPTKDSWSVSVRSWASPPSRRPRYRRRRPPASCAAHRRSGVVPQGPPFPADGQHRPSQLGFAALPALLALRRAGIAAGPRPDGHARRPALHGRTGPAGAASSSRRPVAARRLLVEAARWRRHRRRSRRLGPGRAERDDHAERLAGVARGRPVRPATPELTGLPALTLRGLPALGIGRE